MGWVDSESWRQTGGRSRSLSPANLDHWVQGNATVGKRPPSAAGVKLRWRHERAQTSAPANHGVHLRIEANLEPVHRDAGIPRCDTKRKPILRTPWPTGPLARSPSTPGNTVATVPSGNRVGGIQGRVGSVMNAAAQPGSPTR
jgi:hypothetical protein